jgi:hypothetical protein
MQVIVIRRLVRAALMQEISKINTQIPNKSQIPKNKLKT